MDARKRVNGQNPGRAQPAPGGEAVFFAKLKGSVVVLGTLSGRQISGRLAWVGRYSLILEEEEGAREVLYWKHGLSNIRVSDARRSD